MIKKIIHSTFILTIFFSCTVLSQSIEINYKVKVNKNSVISSTEANYSLVIKQKESIYFNKLEDSLNQFKYKDFISESRKIGQITLVKLDDEHYAWVKQDFFYKDYQQNRLIYNEIAVEKRVIIQESNNLFSWEIVQDSDTVILNHPCQKAISDFRGRRYIAYFSADLHPYGGPWKFDGLPGLILSVFSEDNYFIIHPVQITLKNNSEIIPKNPYTEESIITWEMYKEEIKKILKTKLKKMKSISEAGEKGSIKIGDSIEDLGIGEMSFIK